MNGKKRTKKALNVGKFERRIIMKEKLGNIIRIAYAISMLSFLGSIFNRSIILGIISGTIFMISSLTGLFFTIPMFDNHRWEPKNKIKFNGWDVFGYLLTFFSGVF